MGSTGEGCMKTVEVSPKDYERALNWYDGMMYCQLLVIDDKNDWRLPTIEELKEIYNSENNFDGPIYWSSTEYSGYGAWVQDMSGGGQYIINKIDSYYVRAVRNI